jgi:excisionase family DNA binding protein
MQLDHQKLYSVPEAADFLNISIHTLRAWISQRRIPFIKLGRGVRFRPEDLNEFINSCAVEAKRYN